MFRTMPTTSRVAALVAGTVLVIVACHRDKKAGRAARASFACAEFCRLVVRSSDTTASGECHRGCVAQLDLVGQACEASLFDWMDCETEQAVRLLPIPVKSQCVDQLAKAKACSRDCRQEGILKSGQLSLDGASAPKELAYEVRFHGCESCLAEHGASANSPCQAAKVCESRCFVCRSGQSSVSLRACVNGRCAGPDELDALVPRLDALTPCSGKP